MSKKFAGFIAVGGASAVFLFGAGEAYAANEGGYVGQTYGEAAERIQSWGGKAVVTSRAGSYLPTEKCLVTSSRLPKQQRSGQVLLDLDCNSPVAQAGRAGASVGTAKGQASKSVLDENARISAAFTEARAAGKESWCESSVNSCRWACSRTEGGCSEEVMDFLGL